MSWQYIACGPNRQPIGVLEGVTFSATLRFLQVGSMTVKVPAENVPAGWLDAPGARLVVKRDEKTVCSGALDIDEYNWDADPDSEYAGAGRWDLTFDTDVGRLGYHVMYPESTKSWGNQTISYAFTMPAGTKAGDAINSIVYYQLADNALALRRVPGLKRPSYATDFGAVVPVESRFDLVLDLLRSIAQAGGVGFDVLDDLQGNLQLSIFQPRDLTAQLRFSQDAGNVTSMKVQHSTPTVTDALVAGSGQGVGRYLYEVVNHDAETRYARRESFVDQRQSDDTAQYQKAGQEVIDGAAEQALVQMKIIDSPNAQFGVHFGLGDKVSVLTPFHGEIATVISQVDIDVDETGLEDISSTVGDPQATTDPPEVNYVRSLERRISYLEKAE